MSRSSPIDYQPISYSGWTKHAAHCAATRSLPTRTLLPSPPPGRVLPHATYTPHYTTVGALPHVIRDDIDGELHTYCFTILYDLPYNCRRHSQATLCAGMACPHDERLYNN